MHKVRRTRNDLMDQKLRNAVKFPVSLVAVNFLYQDNLGLLVRAAACFGASEVVVIGSLTENKRLRQASANTSLNTLFKPFKNPASFLEHARGNNGSVLSIELGERSKDIHSYKFSRDCHTYIVVGNETTGVPPEILYNSEHVFVPMPGFGRCLNTSQAANVALYEYAKQMAS